MTIEPFWLGRYEVTWSEYNHYYDLLESFVRFNRLGIRKVTGENQIDAVTAPSLLYDELAYFPATADKRDWPKHPAVSMTQYAAKQYTKWLSKLTTQRYVEGRGTRTPSIVEVRPETDRLWSGMAKNPKYHPVRIGWPLTSSVRLDFGSRVR